VAQVALEDGSVAAQQHHLGVGADHRPYERRLVHVAIAILPQRAEVGEPEGESHALGRHDRVPPQAWHAGAARATRPGAEITVVKLRHEFVLEALEPHANVAEPCRA
jgi:hypothetical protein